MSTSRGAQRGFTLAELLTTIVIMALVMTPIALMIGPLLGSQSSAQAKTDTVQAATKALYKIERDLRNTNLGSIYTCTISGAPVCTSPTTSLGSTSAIVVATSYLNGTGQFQFQTASGKPFWQGADVYWIDPAGNLNYAFDVPTGTNYVKGNLLSANDAQAAINDVTANGGQLLTQFVQQMAIAVPNTGHQVWFQLQAQSTIGASSNETTYRTDLETRN